MKKILLVLLAVLMVLPLSVLPAGAKTASDAAAFDKTAVGTDLAGTTIGGVKFDPARYRYDEKGTLQILTLLEYGYPDDPALYLYLYNPQDLALNTRDRRYAVTLALGDDPNYTKYPLKVLSMSGTDAHSRLWIKCRIDVGADKLTAAFKDTPTRTYRLGEIELVVGDKIRTFPIGGEWTYSGTTAGGDLTSTSTRISVIELELHPLVYRGDAMNGKPGAYDQINSVYFSMPKDFEKEHGEIKSILCTWTEYDSGWILGCKTQDVYDMLTSKGAIGKKLTAHDKNYPSIFYQDGSGPSIFAWNPWPYSSSGVVYFADTLQWLVKYDGSKAKYGAMLETDLQKQMEAAWNAYHNGETNYFSNGGETKTIDILKDQNFAVKVDDGSNWWQKIFSKNHGVETNDNQAFQRVTADALKDPEATLFVDQSYKDELALALSTATVRDEDLMVLHFASCDYYSIPVKGTGNAGDNSTWINDAKEDMYACREQVYMGFDIIQFTCEKDGEKVVVPVSASPINVIGDLQFFDKMKNAPKWVIILIAIILIAAVLFLCPPLLPILVRVIILPFKLLWWLLKAIVKGFAALFRRIQEWVQDRKK